MSHLVVPEIIGNWKKRIYAETMYRALSRRASALLTVSEFSKAELIRLMHPSSKIPIHAIPLGVNSCWNNAKELPRTRSRRYFVCVGNVKPYKNVLRLVEAFLRIREEISLDLLIVGQSEGLITGESATFFERVKEGGHRIEMAGWVSDRDLMALVAHADALVMPSLYEGFGLPALEAMAAGTPVIASRTASLPEVCGDAALYFDPLDVADMSRKLATLAADSSLQASLSEAGNERSRLFTWEACAEATARILCDALA
jgi:glycosyltransferase involved in cell wall biosynthesis